MEELRPTLEPLTKCKIKNMGPWYGNLESLHISIVYHLRIRAHTSNPTKTSNKQVRAQIQGPNMLRNYDKEGAPFVRAKFRTAPCSRTARTCQRHKPKASRKGGSKDVKARLRVGVLAQVKGNHLYMRRGCLGRGLLMTLGLRRRMGVCACVCVHARVVQHLVLAKVYGSFQNQGHPIWTQKNTIPHIRTPKQDPPFAQAVHGSLPPKTCERSRSIHLCSFCLTLRVQVPKCEAYSLNHNYDP